MIQWYLTKSYQNHILSYVYHDFYFSESYIINKKSVNKIIMCHHIIS